MVCNSGTKHVWSKMRHYYKLFMIREVHYNKANIIMRSDVLGLTWWHKQCVISCMFYVKVQIFSVCYIYDISISSYRYDSSIDVYRHIVLY
jgi:hypothetical protein